MLTDENFYKQAEEFRRDLPKIIKRDEDMKRLIDLAKQSPFAGANDDFLRRMEMEHEQEAGKTKILSRILPVIKKMQDE